MTAIQAQAKGPRSLKVGLTDEQKTKRRNCIGGSDANIIMSGDPEKILNLWMEKTGQRTPENLDGVLPVVMGQFTEPLNIYWFERSTGRLVIDEQQEARHEDYEFMTCTLDGKTVTQEGKLAIFEAKHVNAFSKIDDVVQRYMPQLHHNMAVCGLEHAVLSVFKGTLEYESFEVEADFMYTAQLIDAEKKFWEHVQNNTPPYVITTVVAPKLPTVMRTVDMTGNNKWAASAADFIGNQEASKRFEDSKKSIKELIEADVGTATGHGIKAKRDKKGAVTISLND